MRTTTKTPPKQALTDALGQCHQPAGRTARIVSLVPSITELLIELGLAAQLVGRTGFCTHPRQAVAAIPKVGGTKSVNVDQIRALAPTHLIVNIDENEATTVETLRSFVPHIVVTHPTQPQDNLALYQLLGDLFDCAAAAQALSQSLQRELIACANCRWIDEPVLYLIWRDPWMSIASDTYIAAMLAQVGWHTPFGAGGFAGATRYPRLSDDEFAVMVNQVQRVLLSSEPYRFTQQHCDALAKQFPRTIFQLIDGAMTSWYGARAIEGLRYLRELRELRSTSKP